MCVTHDVVMFVSEPFNTNSGVPHPLNTAYTWCASHRHLQYAVPLRATMIKNLHPGHLVSHSCPTQRVTLAHWYHYPGRCPTCLWNDAHLISYFINGFQITRNAWMFTDCFYSMVPTAFKYMKVPCIFNSVVPTDSQSFTKWQPKSQKTI